MDSINKKISQFSPVDTLHTPTARIPLVQGSPLFDAIITPEDLSKGLEQFYNNVYVTVTGENSDLNILKFNTASGSSNLLAGQVAWNRTEGTLDVGMNGGDVIQSLGLELFVRYKATENITNGQLLMYDGTDGNSGVIKLKRATVGCDPKLIYALATEDAQVGGLHFATWYGKVRGLNTSRYITGQELYQSTTTAGGLQSSMPSAPFNKSSYAKVINSHSTVGTVFVRVQHSIKLGDLNDLDIANAAQMMPLVMMSDGVWRESDTVYVNTIQPSSGTLTVDGSLQTGGITADSLSVTSVQTDTMEAEGNVTAQGFVKTGTTSEHLLTGDGGSIEKETLRSTVTSLRHPSTPGTKVVEVNGSGQVLINGDIIQNGQAYKIDAEEVTTKEEIITLRSGSVLGLPTGETAGLKIQKYDGTNDGYIVIDSNGVLRIGDSGSLQPVMTREETPTSYSPIYFNPSTLRGETLPGTTTKSTLVDNDAVMIKDSGDGNKPKWWTFSSIKANLKSYFDTLYISLTGNQTVAGTKTFSSSPVVPTPTSNYHAATKLYSDGVGNAVLSTAQLAASQSLQNAELAQKWASHPEDVVVSGSLYSSRHYMEKSKDIKDYLQSIFDEMYVMPDAYFSGSL